MKQRIRPIRTSHYERKHTCQYVCAFSARAAPDSDGTVVGRAREQLTIR